MYRNQPMTRDAAIDLVTDLGRVLSEKNDDGTAIAGTAKVSVCVNEDSYDACIPIELLTDLYGRAYRGGFRDARRIGADRDRERRISRYERLLDRKPPVPLGILDHEGGRPDGA